MRENESVLENFHRLFNAKGHVMVWAPRQSGKTFSLVRKFLETRNSLIFSPSSSVMRTVDETIYRLGAPNRRRDSYSLAYSDGDVVRGRRLDYVFVDEIDQYRGDIGTLFRNLVPTDAKVIAISTPSNVRQADEFVSCFDSIFTYSLNTDQIHIHKQPFQGVQINVNDHFETDQELFKI